MFKVFIYLYIFLESVLCKTWFWLFAQSGEVGAAVLVAVWVAAGKCPRLVATKGKGGGVPVRSEEASQHCLAYSVLTGECHPCHKGQSPLGQKQHFASSPLFLSSSSLASCPCGEGSCPFFSDSPPFSTQIPQSMQRVLQGLEVVPDLPSPQVQQGGYLHQPAPCGLLRALQAWCHPGGCCFMVLPAHEVQLQVPFLSRAW